ncbi:MAG: hemolysin family protein [Treponema sp.]|nr:hemolysin family protein [Treponema sp.]
MIGNIITLLLILVLILFVGFFTSSETAYLSLSKLKVRSLVEQKKKNAKVVAKLKEDMDKLLTTVLIGTNFLNSLVSALATALVVKIFGGGGVGLPTFAIAFFITTFGQIIPKTLAGLYPDKVASAFSVPLYILKIILFPLVWLFERLSHLVVKVVEKVIKPSGAIVTEEELKTIIDLGEKEGTIEKDESRMMNKIIQFNDLEVNDIMKHRSLVNMISETADYNEVIQTFMTSGLSNLTVYKEEKENVTGVINYKNILFGSKDDDLGTGYAGRVMKDVLYVPGTFSVLEILKKFRESEDKFAVVLNEQGQTSGIITMEDIMKVVFGRMTDVTSYDNLPAVEKIKPVGKNTVLVPGDVKLEEINELLNLKLESEDMNTLGGWMLEQFGYLPSVGSVMVYEGNIFTAEDIFQRRISSVKIRIR